MKKKKIMKEKNDELGLLWHIEKNKNKIFNISYYFYKQKRLKKIKKEYTRIGTKTIVIKYIINEILFKGMLSQLSYKEITNKSFYYIYKEFEDILSDYIWNLSKIIFIKLYEMKNNNKYLMKCYNIKKKDLISFNIIYKINLLKIKLMLYYIWDVKYYINNGDIKKINEEFIWDEKNYKMYYSKWDRLLYVDFIKEDKKENEFFDIYLNEEFYKKLFFLIEIEDIVLNEKEIIKKKIQKYFKRNQQVILNLGMDYSCQCTVQMSDNLKGSIYDIIKNYKEEWLLLKSNKIGLKITYDILCYEIENLLNNLLLNIDK